MHEGDTCRHLLPLIPAQSNKNKPSAMLEDSIEELREWMLIMTSVNGCLLMEG